MKTALQRLIPPILGAVGFLLRFLQQGIFEPDTGLAQSGAPISYAMALYLAAVGVFLLAWALREKKETKLDMDAGFVTPPQRMLPLLVCAVMLIAVGGALVAYSGYQAGEVLHLALGGIAVVAAVCLLWGLTAWRRGGNCGALLVAPALMSVVWLLITYRQYADYPVLETLYVQILAIAAFTYGFYQVAAYGFSLGSRRTTRFILPAATVLGLTVLADDISLGLICLYVGCTVVLYGFSLLERPAHMD